MQHGLRMKVIVCRRYGLPEVLTLEEVPRPTPGDGEVLVEVRAASVNSWDWDLLRGTPFLNRIGGLRRPRHPILGADVAGRVAAVGRNVRQFQPGDEVFGDLSASGWGGFAEYVCARAEAWVSKPAGIPFEAAAAVPQAAVMALLGLRDIGHVQPGQRVLLNGAGGGVGTFAIQLAKSFGAEVTGVDRTEKLEPMRKLGADHVIDYTREDFTRNGRQYDLILDVVAFRSMLDCQRALAPKGAYVVIGGATGRILQALVLAPWVRMAAGRRLVILIARANKDLAYLAQQIDAGRLTPVIDRRYPLAEVPDALRYFGGGHAFGKVVITM